MFYFVIMILNSSVSTLERGFKGVLFIALIFINMSLSKIRT